MMTRTKKISVAPAPKYHGLTFKVEETVLKSQPKSVPVNLAEEKEKFIRYGKTPKFEVQDPEKIHELAEKAKNKIRFDLQGEAEYILEKVRDEYGDGEHFLQHAFGPRINKEEATPLLLKYIAENNLTESLTIHWCDNLACSAKMVWKGPMVNCNRPELRKYSLWINGSDENNYMRESGIHCLMDHEIGTHFFRMLNDGFQPWFSDRARFGLRRMGTVEGQCTEEGLATIHTVLRGRVKLLWGAALAYYTACKSAEMSFKQLFDHIGRFTSNPDYRWKQVMRVKRGLADPNDLGGFGNDQCYFEGAVTLLRNRQNIDFSLLMCGKVCHDELDRIKRVVRKDCLRYPLFMQNMVAYKKTLQTLARQNGLIDTSYPIQKPPSAYLRRLDERRTNNGGGGKKSKKVRLGSKVGLARGKLNKIQVRKGDGDKRLVKDDGELKSHKVSYPFATLQNQQDEETRKSKETAKTYENFERRSTELARLDTSMEKQIRELQDIVKGHSWCSTDSGYKESLLSQASSELTHDSLIASGDCLRAKSAIDSHSAMPSSVVGLSARPKTAKDAYHVQEILGKISPCSPDPDYCARNNSCPLESDVALGKRNDLPRPKQCSTGLCKKYDSALFRKTFPAQKKKNDTNFNNSQMRYQRKELVHHISGNHSGGKPKSAPATKKKKKQRVDNNFFRQEVQEKMNNLRTTFESQINPDDMVIYKGNVSPSLSDCSGSSALTEECSSSSPQFNSSGSLITPRPSSFTYVELDGKHSDLVENIYGIEEARKGHGLLTASDMLKSHCSQSVDTPVIDGKRQTRQKPSKLSLDLTTATTKTESGFFFEKKTDSAPDGGQDSDVSTPREKAKKSRWDYLVSRYAQKKPEAPKPKLDREYLRADMCQPFFAQAERILRAEKVLQKTKSRHRRLHTSTPAVGKKL